MQKYLYLIASCLLLLACSQEESLLEEEVERNDTYCLSESIQQDLVLFPVEEQEIQEQLTLTGKVEYDQNDLVEFKSLLSGVVQQVSFEVGDYVRKGQVLASIQSAQIQEMYQQREMLKNQIDLLGRQLQSNQELLEDGMASVMDVLEIERERTQVRIELEHIDFVLNMYQASGRNTFQILAPKNGYIIRKSMSSGQVITEEDEPLFAISNLEQVWVMINVYASSLRYIQVGDEVKVKTVAYPDKSYAGKIDKIYHVFDDDEHVLKAKVVLNNQELHLMPGLSADIIIDKKSNGNRAFAVPHKSTVFSNNNQYVVLYRGECDMEYKLITPIASSEDYIYVEEKFSPDDQVIAKHALLVFEELSN